MDYIDNLQANQFLKVTLLATGNLCFEIYEQPIERWRRPLRWSIIMNRTRLVNRHTIKSKIHLINETLSGVLQGFYLEYHPEQL